jgi:hypothetical protein
MRVTVTSNCNGSCLPAMTAAVAAVAAVVAAAAAVVDVVAAAYPMLDCSVHCC